MTTTEFIKMFTKQLDDNSNFEVKCDQNIPCIFCERQDFCKTYDELYKIAKILINKQ